MTIIEVNGCQTTARNQFYEEKKNWFESIDAFVVSSLKMFAFIFQIYYNNNNKNISNEFFSFLPICKQKRMFNEYTILVKLDRIWN